MVGANQAILHLSDRVRRFRQLVHQNTGLAIEALRSAITVCGKELSDALEHMRILLAGSANDIAAKLDWPAGTAGILHRLWRPAATFGNITLLKGRLRSNDASGRRARRVLQHGRCIHVDAIRIASDPAALAQVKNSLLVDLCAQTPTGFRTGTGDYEILSCLLLAKHRFGLRLPTIRTPAELRRLGEHHFSILNPKDVQELLVHVFAPPPLPSSEDLVFRPLCDPFSALREYAVMGPNCIPDLFPALAEGSLALYQISADARRQTERATLVIRREQKSGGRQIWMPDDARTRRNHPISKTTHDAIIEFLCSAQELAEADLLPDGLADLLG